MNENDIVKAVTFAKNHNLRLVVKGTGNKSYCVRQKKVQFENISQFSLGHDYYGRSSGANSLLVWTHSMRGMEFHDDFTPAGGGGQKKSHRAVTLEAGLTWLDVYAAASVDRGVYVQGGGCTSVGVIGKKDMFLTDLKPLD